MKLTFEISLEKTLFKLYIQQRPCGDSVKAIDNVLSKKKNSKTFFF